MGNLGWLAPGGAAYEYNRILTLLLYRIVHMVHSTFFFFPTGRPSVSLDPQDKKKEIKEKSNKSNYTRLTDMNPSIPYSASIAFSILSPS